MNLLKVFIISSFKNGSLVPSVQVLDEVQAYILLSRYIEGGARLPFSADRAFLQAVSFVLRICWVETLNVVNHFFKL